MASRTKNVYKPFKVVALLIVVSKVEVTFISTPTKSSLVMVVWL